MQPHPPHSPPKPTPLYHTITTHPHRRQSTYHQFCLDIKRQTLLVNGRPDAEHALASESTLYAWILNLFTDETVGLWFAYWCTQTALASVYQEMMMYLNRPDNDDDNAGNAGNNGNAGHEPSSSWCPSVHLLDDGRQRIDICTESQVVEMVGEMGDDGDDPMMGSWSFATVVKREPMLHLTKPFRVFRQDDWGGRERGYEEGSPQVVCRYMLHVWVYGCAARLGSYRVVWEEVDA